MRIFIAEDERDLNEIITQKLTAEGYSVDSCYDGAEAIDILSYTDYDAVILDIMMPKADGFAVLRALLGLRAGKVLDFMQKYGLVLVLLLSLLGVLNSYLFLMRGLSIALFARLFG